MKKLFNEVKCKIAVAALTAVLSVSTAIPAFATAVAVPTATTNTTTTITNEIKAIELTPDGEDSVDDFSVKEVKNNDILIEGKIGFDSKYVVRKTTPFNITVTNNGEDINGNIEVKIYTDSYTYGNTGRENAGRYAVYYLPLELPKGSSKQVSMEIALPTISKDFSIALTNTKGKVIASKNISATAIDPAVIMAGVLSDNLNDINYLKDVGFATEQFNDMDYDEVVFFDKVSFPQSQAILDNFKVLIINDFDTRQLSEEQVLSLDDWVKKGGMLVLGTGVNAQKVLGGLETITDFEIKDNKVLNSLPFVEELMEMPSGSIKNLSIAEIDAENSQILLGDVNDVLTFAVDLGLGTIVVHNFDLGLKPITEINNIDVLLASMYQSASDGNLNVNFEDSYRYYGNSTNDIPFLKSGIIFAIFAIIICYVIFIGPILYFALKKKDKRELGWIIIPSVALISTAVIFIISQGSMYQNDIVSVASTINVNKNTGVADINIAERSSRKGDIKVSLDEDINMDIAGSDNYYNAPKDEMIFKKLAQRNGEITFTGSGSWEANMLKGSKTITLDGNLESSFNVDGGVIKGSITNNTGIDLEDVIVGMNEMYTVLGDIKNGETAEVTYDVNSQYWSAIHYIANMYFNDRNYYNSGVMMDVKSDSDNYTKRTRRNYIMNYNNSRSSTAYTSKYGYFEPFSNLNIQVFGFNDNEIIEGKFDVNGKEPLEIVSNMYTFDLEFDIFGGESYVIPYGFITPNTITLNGVEADYDYYGNNTIYPYNDGEMKIVYSAPESGKLNLFQIEQSQDASMGQVGNYEIFNVETQLWEGLSTEPYQDTAKYISEENKITIRLNVFGGQEIMFPEIRMEGEN